MTSLSTVLVPLPRAGLVLRTAASVRGDGGQRSIRREEGCQRRSVSQPRQGVAFAGRGCGPQHHFPAGSGRDSFPVVRPTDSRLPIAACPTQPDGD